MLRCFNTAGPCQEDIHYLLPPTFRIPELTRLIDQRNYFVIHAPRQTGKSTAMLALAQQLTQSGRYTSVLLSVEAGSPFNDDPDRAERIILDAWMDTASIYLPESLVPTIDWKQAEPGRRINYFLRQWAKQSDRPLVILIDEIDSLQNETLLSILRQLRDGFPSRPLAFPHSVGLIGLRDVRDYKVVSDSSDRLNTSSPFNIKVRSIVLRDFNAAEVAELYQQHTDETGQAFTPEAIALAFELTQGQPWLVNALAKEVVEELVTDPTVTITAQHILEAKEILIKRQDTHLDSLGAHLQESWVRTIIEPVLTGLALDEMSHNAIQLSINLGLCKMRPNGGLAIANPIYHEVLRQMLNA